MPIPLANTFDAGQADGTTISAANSGGTAGDAFDTVTVGAGNTFTFESDVVDHGSQAAKVVLAGAAHPTMEFIWNASMPGSLTEIWGRQYLYRTALPASSHKLIRFFNNASATNGFISINGTGKIQALDSVSAGATGTVTIALNQWIRIEYHLICSATVGFIEALLFNTKDSETPDETITSAANKNTLADVHQVHVGIVSSTDNGGGFRLGDLQVNNTDYPGPGGLPGPGEIFGPAIMRPSFGPV
jgi:hypothetical protein